MNQYPLEDARIAALILVAFVSWRLAILALNWWSKAPPAPAPLPGVYRHFKHGALYRVHWVARNATNSARVKYEPLVCYEALDKTQNCRPNSYDGIDANVGFFVRSLSEFTEVVKWPDGQYRRRWELVEADPNLEDDEQ